MIQENYANFIGTASSESVPVLEQKHPGSVVVIHPGEIEDRMVNPNRIKVYLTDQGIILKIVNG